MSKIARDPLYRRHRFPIGRQDHSEMPGSTSSQASHVTRGLVPEQGRADATNGFRADENENARHWRGRTRLRKPIGMELPQQPLLACEPDLLGGIARGPKRVMACRRTTANEGRRRVRNATFAASRQRAPAHRARGLLGSFAAHVVPPLRHARARRLPRNGPNHRTDRMARSATYSPFLAR
jgi:hypothetical protein